VDPARFRLLADLVDRVAHQGARVDARRAGLEALPSGSQRLVKEHREALATDIHVFDRLGDLFAGGGLRLEVRA